jgi:hypothetical protein
MIENCRIDQHAHLWLNGALNTIFKRVNNVIYASFNMTLREFDYLFTRGALPIDK